MNFSDVAAFNRGLAACQRSVADIPDAILTLPEAPRLCTE